MEHNFQIPTPLDYVDKLLDIANYKENLFGKTILENSCGDGNILVEIVRRYILDSKNHGFDKSQISKGLERDIWAYEIDENCVETCLKRLEQLRRDEGLRQINWNIINDDYLFSDSKQYCFIVGNPPFITYHNLPLNTREKLKASFKSCSKGRFDYCYAFIEKSLVSLKESGVLAYIVPFSIFRNEFAQAIREEIKPNLTDIYDLTGEEVFSNVTASCAIIKIDKKQSNNNICYHKVSSSQETDINKNNLLSKWFFEQENKGRRFGDYFTVQNSVATLCNEAFVISNYSDEGEYIVTNGKRIEKALIHEAASTRSYKNGKRDRIIFPYIIDRNVFERIDISILQSKYPETYKYLSSFKNKLLQRNINAGVKWYEYGRTQALTAVYGKKIIIPMIITTKVTAYLAKENAIPYAGYFIKQRDNSPYTLKDAKNILESSSFYRYVQNVGTPTTKTSFRVSVKEIENYNF